MSLKRLFIFGAAIFLCQVVHGTHGFRNSASNINSGILPNARLDSSSVTLQGNAISISSVASGLNTLLVSSGTTFLPLDGSTNTKTGGITLGGQINNVIISHSSTTTQGNTVNISTTASAVNRIESTSNTVWMNLDNSTPTKLGGITINGQINNVIVTHSSITTQGNTVNISTVAGRVNTINTATFTVQGITVNGNVTATAFSGDGSALTGISGTTGSVLSNLVVSTNGTNTNQVTIKADAINVMADLWVNMATAATLAQTGGPGGSVIGDVASTWYAVFAISNGSTMSVIVDSANVSNPALPTGYTRHRRVGYIYNDSSSNLVPMIQNENIVRLYTSLVPVSGVDPGAGNTLTSLENFIPPNTLEVFFQFTLGVTNSGRIAIAPDGFTLSDGPSTLWGDNSGGGNHEANAVIPMNGSRAVVYSDSGSTVTSFTARIHAYTIRL